MGIGPDLGGSGRRRGHGRHVRDVATAGRAVGGGAPRAATGHARWLLAEPARSGGLPQGRGAGGPRWPRAGPWSGPAAAMRDAGQRAEHDGRLALALAWMA